MTDEDRKAARAALDGLHRAADSDGPIALTEGEKRGLRALLYYRDDILAEFEYRRARNLMVKQYRAFVVTLAAFLAFVVAMADDLKRAIAWLLR